MLNQFIPASLFLSVILCAGLIATSAMTIFLRAVTRSGLTNADMERAIGSLLTKSLDSALLVGVLMHFTAGIFFAMIYALLFMVFGASGPWQLAGIGLIMGTIHGFVLSFLLVISVAEYHPLPQFRDVGFGVTVAHLIGHSIYGAVVGFMIGASGLL